MHTKFHLQHARMKWNPNCMQDFIQWILQTFACMHFRQRSRNQTVYFPLWAAGNSDRALLCVIIMWAVGLLYLLPNGKQTLLLWRVLHATVDKKWKDGEEKKTLNNLNHSYSEQLESFVEINRPLKLSCLFYFLGCLRLSTKTLTFLQKHI